jgi:hypothetical protein
MTDEAGGPVRQVFRSCPACSGSARLTIPCGVCINGAVNVGRDDDRVILADGTTTVTVTPRTCDLLCEASVLMVAERTLRARNQADAADLVCRAIAALLAVAATLTRDQV